MLVLKRIFLIPSKISNIEREVKEYGDRIEFLLRNIKETDMDKTSCKKLITQKKWKIFLEISAEDIPVGEMLSCYGLYHRN